MSELLKHDRSSTAGLRLTASTELPTLVADTSRPPSSRGTRLKIVTVSPESDRSGFSEGELGTGRRRSQPDPYLGSTIDGRYKVEAVLGEGGMGVVYRCSHTIIGKKVAMKVLRADLARDSELTERFLNEAKAASAIGNPHIIDISDFGRFPDGSTYFIMEYLSGSPLSKMLEGGQRVPEGRILHIARQLAEGLAAAHVAGIVHRDLKPDNIFLIDHGTERDFVKILDFGIAKVSSSETGKLTRAGAVFGTPHYMSPEQAAGVPIDHRGDIYALGVILYEMATGRVPFDADNFMAILSQHVHKTPLPLRVSPETEEVPEGLEAIVLKCLSKLPDQRYQTMQELLADLSTLSSGRTPEAVADMASRPPPSLGAASTRPPGHRGRVAAILGGALAASAIVGAVLARSGQAPEPAPEPARVIAPPAPPPPVAAPAKKQVVIATDPLDAHVFRGEVDLGASPVMLELAAGEQIELSIRRDGYRDATLSVDSESPRLAVRLERLARPTNARSAARPRTTPARASGIAGENGIVNPWASQR